MSRPATGPSAAEPSPAPERLRSRTALIVAVLLGAIVAGGIAAAGSPPAAWVAPPLVALAAHRWLTRRDRRRAKVRRQPFPDEWEKVLLRKVAFYVSLDAAGRARFRDQLRIFLAEKRITGIRSELDETTRVLVGASAIIPVFGFPDWDWDQISEVLVYPERFGRDFESGEGADANVLGMVGTGAMNRMMILSKPDLLHGFRNPRDRRNVGIHEFAHLVDKSDGAIDGFPGVGLSRGAVEPWLELMRRKMEEIAAGRSDIDPYALTNEAEFFAVVTEYFFEKPEKMQRKHPELHAMLTRAFRQDLRSRLADLVAGKPRRRLGRNSPCPCGSGRKYKKCCLGK